VALKRDTVFTRLEADCYRRLAEALDGGEAMGGDHSGQFVRNELLVVVSTRAKFRVRKPGQHELAEARVREHLG
jgi:hypothetical protein